MLSVIKIPKSFSKIEGIQLPKINIPKIIHQTYKTRDLLPAWKETPLKWQEFHPEWKYIFWTDDDCRTLIKEHYPWFLHIFDSYEHPIQRADAVRYFILYHYGGVYADLDYHPTKPFDDLFYKEHDVYLVMSGNLRYITNSLMASKIKAAFWLTMFKTLQDQYRDPGLIGNISKHFHVMNTTGPCSLTIALENYNNNEKNRKLVGMLPSELIAPSCCNICTERPCQTPDGYTKIIDGSSWISTDTQIYLFVFCNYPYIIAVFALLIVLFILKRHMNNK
jgi:mannosyltransferase OCH1-like enzyme